MELLIPTVLEDMAVLGRALVAAICGGLIGWEREKAGKWAGFRTHMLVCVAAMAFMRVGMFLVASYDSHLREGLLRADPVRILEAIVTGISFIAAGTVFRDRSTGSAQGLTTAATLLAVGPVGVAIAADRYILSIGLTAMIFVILRVLGRLEHRAQVHSPKDAQDRTEKRSDRGERGF